MEDHMKPDPPTATDMDIDVDAEETPTVASDPDASDPGPKYHPKQRVYAKDTSCGLWYEAVVRRVLFGVNHNKQVQIGLVSNESEIEDILAQSKNNESHHYFVHYNNWNVNWDRWISEEDIMEDKEQSKRIAQRFAQEHKQVQKEMKNTRGKAKDGTAFLKAWRARMDQIIEEMNKEQQASDVAAAGNDKEGDGKAPTDNTKLETDNKPNQKSDKPNNKKATMAKAKAKGKKKNDKTWDKAAIDEEYNLRLRGLEGKKCATSQYKVTLPFSLKKVMVEAWEIITQCQMVADLPASVTVRQALDKYLQSKLDLIDASAAKLNSDKADALSNDTGSKTKDQSPDKEVKAEEKDAEEARQLEEKENLAKRRQEWIDMVEGIAMFFDDALPYRLLYTQELAQFKVVESTMEVAIKADETELDNKQPEDSSGKVKKEDTQNDDEKMACETSPTKNIALKEESESPTTKDPPTNDGIQDAASSTVANSSTPDAPGISNGEQEQGAKPTEQPTPDTTKSEGNKKSGTKTRPMLPSDVYGCEHLLRFFVKVPEILAEQQSKLAQVEAGGEALEAFEKQTKQVLAKINDLIRFFHKNQSTIFADSYRKLNEDEIREQQKWIRYVERKRKRAMEEKEEEAQKKTTASPSAKVGGASSNNEDDASVASKLQKVS